MLPQDQTQQDFINPGMFVLCLDGLAMTLLHNTDKYTSTKLLNQHWHENVGQKL